ncbi:MAG: Mur ligase family protein, partial [Verrucomicrobiota bacterium]|nr:Mur ligase family protein [Verrucomicrobiota bacterium]
MEPRSLKFVADACGGTLKNGAPETIVFNICTDSRLAKKDDLFIALAGENFDAHNFLSEVAEKKVAAVIAEQNKIPSNFSGCAIIAVENSRRALGQLASQYRADFDLPIIAVGGSNGKTSTKELIAAVLRQKFFTLWSEASFNNEVGVPLTLLRLEKNHQAAVLETGTNHPGELASLLRMIRPGYSV